MCSRVLVTVSIIFSGCSSERRAYFLFRSHRADPHIMKVVVVADRSDFQNRGVGPWMGFPMTRILKPGQTLTGCFQNCLGGSHVVEPQSGAYRADPMLLLNSCFRECRWAYSSKKGITKKLLRCIG